MTTLTMTLTLYQVLGTYPAFWTGVSWVVEQYFLISLTLNELRTVEVLCTA